MQLNFCTIWAKKCKSKKTNLFILFLLSADEINQEIGLPIKKSTRVLTPGVFLIGCDAKTGHTHWVFTTISLDNFIEDKCNKKSMGFRIDHYNHPTISQTLYSKRCKSYNSEHDHGHLAPKGHYVFSLIHYWSTFIHSNCVKQLPRFNRFIWLILERFERQLGRFSIVHTCNGLVYNEKLKNEQLPIATHFYKIILQGIDDKNFVCFCFWLPHKVSKMLTKFQLHLF